MALVTTDPRLCEGAYIKRDGNLYYVLGREWDDEGALTGCYALEDCRGERSATGGNGTMVHRRVVANATAIVGSYELVREAPRIGDVPAHLDREMEQHLTKVGAPRKIRNYGRGGDL